jgi:hypothetical protein
MELNMKTLIAALTLTILIAAPPVITPAAAEFADNIQSSRQNDNQTYKSYHNQTYKGYHNQAYKGYHNQAYKGYPLGDWYSHGNSNSW